MPVVGFLNPGSPEPFAFMVTAFHEGLKKASYVEGQNVRIEYRWAAALQGALRRADLKVPGWLHGMAALKP